MLSICYTLPTSDTGGHSLGVAGLVLCSRVVHDDDLAGALLLAACCWPAALVDAFHKAEHCSEFANGGQQQFWQHVWPSLAQLYYLRLIDLYVE